MSAATYERNEYEKLVTVIRAAGQNASDKELRITTSGHDPSVSIRIQAYVLEKFLKNPKDQ